MQSDLCDLWLESLPNHFRKSQELKTLGSELLLESLPQYMRQLVSEGTYGLFINPSPLDGPSNLAVWIVYHGETILMNAAMSDCVENLMHRIQRNIGISHLVVEAKNGRWLIQIQLQPYRFLVWSI